MDLHTAATCVFGMLAAWLFCDVMTLRRKIRDYAKRDPTQDDLSLATTHQLIEALRTRDLSFIMLRPSLPEDETNQPSSMDIVNIPIIDAPDVLEDALDAVLCHLGEDEEDEEKEDEHEDI